MKSTLQQLFKRRLAEEMAARGLSANALARAAKLQGIQISQTAISKILRGTMEPGLGKVEALAHLLSLPPWYLLTDREHVEHTTIRAPVAAVPQNVVVLGSPYPKIFAPKRPAIQAPEKKVVSKKKR